MIGLNEGQNIDEICQLQKITQHFILIMVLTLQNIYFEREITQILKILEVLHMNNYTY